MRKQFEIVYSNCSIVAGSTVKQFRAAPAGKDDADDGILFVIVAFKDGRVEKQKALSWYTFKGAKKPGAWTTDKNYQFVKDQLGELSSLL